ncbi:MAG: RNA-binding protein [Thermoanaerobaculaceae bacterium]|jgi:cold-inducible RNA-binding protein|nr:RNA-binding protein [Thermoanaerobaculaceae bacterium]
MKLYVGNLPFSTNEQDLRNLFGAYGEPSRVTLVVDRMSGRSRGFGFVEYEDAGSAQAAIQGLNGKDFGGRALVVNEARSAGREGRQGGRDGGFGGGFGSGRRDGRGSGRRGSGGWRSDF